MENQHVKGPGCGDEFGDDFEAAAKVQFLNLCAREGRLHAVATATVIDDASKLRAPQARRSFLGLCIFNCNDSNSVKQVQ